MELPNSNHQQDKISASGSSTRKSSESPSEEDQADMSQKPPEIIIDTTPIDGTDLNSSVVLASSQSDANVPLTNGQNSSNGTHTTGYPNFDENGYDVPEIQVSSDDVPLYAEVDKPKKTKKEKEQDMVDTNYDFDQGTMFIGDNTVLIFDERTKL